VMALASRLGIELATPTRTLHIAQRPPGQLHPSKDDSG